VIIMEIRISGKRDKNIGFCSLGSWIKETKDKRKVLIIDLGEITISMFPFDKRCVHELGKKLQEITEL